MRQYRGVEQLCASRSQAKRALRMAMQRAPRASRSSESPSRGIATKKKYRGVEQLVARRAHNPKVVGSSPAPATISSGCNGFELHPLIFYADIEIFNFMC